MVQFPLEPGKPPVLFRFNVTSAQALEQAGGANPAYLASTGRQVTALVLMVWHGLQHADAGITERKAKQLVQRYLDGGGKVKALMDALAKALEESGVYGDAEQPDEGDDARPPSAAPTP